MENVYFQQDRRDLRASTCLEASADGMAPWKAEPSQNEDREYLLIHGVAKLDEGLVGVGKADQALAGIFDLERRVDS
jgi:hypothetical protein